MPTLPINGAHLRVRMAEVELDRLKLDPDNPRLHSAYLTHLLPSRPSESQILQALESLPEFGALIDAISRNHGCFQPPLVTVDYRVLEGNRRVTALRKLRIKDPQNDQWAKVTIHQLAARVSPEQERALRGKFHLEQALAWDGLSQLTEYVSMAERDGLDALATMLGKFRSSVEPVVVAGQAVRLFSQNYAAEAKSEEFLWVLVGLCGVREIVPKVMISTAARCIYTADDEKRPREQPFTLTQMMKWLAEGRFTKPYEESGKQHAIKRAQIPAVFRDVRRAGEEALSYFLEEGGTLAKAAYHLNNGYSAFHREQIRLLKQSQQYLDVLGALRAIRRDEHPDLYREALAIYHRLSVLLSPRQKEATNVQ
jgi:hypothetical protein